MILLDTNVLSSLMRDAPDASVEQWLDEQPAESIWTTTITVFEIRFGLALLPPSRRRDRLERAFAQATEVVLGRRILSFDPAAARAAAAMAAEQSLRGWALEIRDVQIAGIAAARNATLATRNLRHFIGLGIALVDPWSA